MSSRIQSKHPLRIGIVGAGGIVRTRHLPGLQKLRGVQINALANSSPQSAEAFRREFSLSSTVYADWRELIEKAEVDCLWIGATPYLHEPCTIAALERGCHVFCQARMARTFAEAQRMLDCSLQHPSLVAMLCPPPFGLAEDAWMLAFLQSGKLGRLHSLRLRSVNGAWLDPAAPAHWRQREEISGHNIMTLGIFTEVLQRWFGPVLSVSSEGQIATPVRRGYTVRIPDLLHVQARFGGGLLSQWEFSGLHAGPAVNDLLVTAEAGDLHFDFDAGRASLRRRGTQKWTPLVIPKKMLRPWQVEADFIEAVRNPGGPRPRPDFSEGLSYMRVVEAVHESLSTGRRIPVFPGL